MTTIAKAVFSVLLAALFATACGSSASARQPAPAMTAVAAFSPKGDSLGLILRVIGEARQSIDVAAYSFTSKPIALALLQAHKRGVRVRIVADGGSNKGRYSAAAFMAGNGVPVRLSDGRAVLHNKFMIFDSLHVETGSFNYSASAAAKNAENVLYLKNAPDIARAYAAEWQRLWDEGAPLPAGY